jgi:hypothetical protein
MVSGRERVQITAAATAPPVRPTGRAAHLRGVTYMRIFRFVAVAGVLALFGAADVQAQTIGFKMGASFSNVSIDPDDEDTSTLTAFTGGGFVRFPMGPIYLQPELMYITKGFKVEDPDSDAEGKFKLSYIEIPVLLVLPLMQGGSFSPYILGGPAFAFEASCKVSFEGGGVSGEADCDEGGEDLDRKKFDVGAMFGLGFGFPAGPGSILVEGRYNFGLMNLSEVDDTSFKHRSGAVLVGYSIPLTR